MEVIALIGNMYAEFGICAMVSLKSITILPIISEAGINILWFEVLKIIFAICGTANPINAIGPENAVITPVKIAVIKIMYVRVFFMLTPRLFA